MYRRGQKRELWHVHAFRLGPYRFHLLWRPSCRARDCPGDSVPARACCRCESLGVRKHHPRQPRQAGSHRLSFSFDNFPGRGVGKIANTSRNPRRLRTKRTEGNNFTPLGLVQSVDHRAAELQQTCDTSPTPHPWRERSAVTEINMPGTHPYYGCARADLQATQLS